MPWPLRGRGALLASVWFVLSARARAEPAQEPSDAPESVPSARPVADVEPPALLAAADAEYPAEAAARRLEGSVVLTLQIDVEGIVRDATIAEAAGHGFDEAARVAALSFRFAPARRSGVAVAARIRYRYDFRLPPAPVPVPAPSAPGPQPVLPAPPPTAAPATRRPRARPVRERRGERPVEGVVVRGFTDVERRRRSAEAVTVVETTEAKRHSADLGEVLARTHGVSVRREGGLGSGTRFALNGLGDDRVRFFLDGVPLELAGYSAGIANVPVNLLERVEIYSGVVPIRFGADALGGAVNLVSDQAHEGRRLSGSYEVGSFDTHRLTLSYKNLHAPTGWFARIDGFFDYARNDYAVDVEVPDDSGRLAPARVRRFHDAYRAVGVHSELGFVERRWARRALVRAFATDYDKQAQHNLVMSVPYGGVMFAETSRGASFSYQHSLGRGWSLGAVTGFVHSQSRFLDVATCIYDWFGRCVRERAAGETDDKPHDRLVWENTGFARINLGFQLAPEHGLRLSLAPTYVHRTGDELAQADASTRDPTGARHELSTLVNGLEYRMDLRRSRLENILFVKQYAQRLTSDEPRPGGYVRERERSTHHPGFGNGVRLGFSDWLYLKASYEWATTLPRPDQVFGDNAFIAANLDLLPERSHNLNGGIYFDVRELAGSAFRAGINGFLRGARDLIVMIGAERAQSFRNVNDARSLGVEAAAGWTSPAERLALDANLTYQDFRNTSGTGTYGRFQGDRIPNQPWLFANVSARLAWQSLFQERDELALSWQARYVHGFFRAWESVGRRDSKQRVDAHLLHTAAISYLVRRDSANLSSTLEVQNVTDRKVFDFWGAQRPGRAFFMKFVAEL